MNKQLRALRLQKELSQENVAFELGISQKAYSDIEKGKTNISHKKILRLSKVLETTPDKICPIAQQCICSTKKTTNN